MPSCIFSFIIYLAQTFLPHDKIPCRSCVDAPCIVTPKSAVTALRRLLSVMEILAGKIRSHQSQMGIIVRISLLLIGREAIL